MRNIVDILKDKLRDLKWWFQKKRRGWSDKEIWNLDNTIVEWLVPRLKEFKKITQGYPGNLESFEQWQDILDEMIFGFEWKDNEWYAENVFGLQEEEKNEKMKEFKDLMKRAEEGRILFAKYFCGLWW